MEIAARLSEKGFERNIAAVRDITPILRDFAVAILENCDKRDFFMSNNFWVLSQGTDGFDKSAILMAIQDLRAIQKRHLATNIGRWVNMNGGKFTSVLDKIEKLNHQVAAIKRWVSHKNSVSQGDMNGSSISLGM